MMRKIAFIAAILFLPLALFARQPGLVPLDDSSMGEVFGQAGIAMDLQLTVNADSTGSPLPNLNYCSGANDPCRMSFQFNNRGSAEGEWITWKNFFGVLRLNNVWIDADQSLGVASQYADNSENNRFMSGGVAPTCLLPGGGTTAATCHQGTLNMPMLALQFNNGGASGIELFLNIGAVAVEYGSTGYLDNTNEAALGVMIADTRGWDNPDNPVAYPAQIKVGGTMGLYGF